MYACVEQNNFKCFEDVHDECMLFTTSLFIVWVCVYAYTEPLGQHAGISELLLFIYLIFEHTFSHVDSGIMECRQMHVGPGGM